MAEKPGGTKPAQFRLPPEVIAYVEERSTRYGTTKTAVILEAVELLREHETEQLMREGYREMDAQSVATAEEGLAAGNSALPEW
jgi:predicted DNA-binding protein